MVISKLSKPPKTQYLQSGSSFIKRLQITKLSLRGGYLSNNDFENNFPADSSHHILLSNETEVCLH